MLSAQWVSCHECYIPNASKDPKAASNSYNYYVLKVETQGFRVKASRFDVISPLIKSHLTNTKQLKILQIEHFELRQSSSPIKNEIAILIQQYIYNVET
jgi:hypothetical protein